MNNITAVAPLRDQNFNIMEFLEIVGKKTVKAVFLSVGWTSAPNPK